MAAVNSTPTSFTLSPSGGFSRSCFTTAATTSCPTSGSLQIDKRFSYGPQLAVSSEANEESDQGDHDVMIGNMEKIWLPMVFRVVLSRENDVGSFFMAVPVEAT